MFDETAQSLSDLQAAQQRIAELESEKATGRAIQQALIDAEDCRDCAESRPSSVTRSAPMGRHSFLLIPLSLSSCEEGCSGERIES